MARPIPRWQQAFGSPSSQDQESRGLADDLIQSCVKLLVCLLAQDNTKDALVEEDYSRLRTETRRLNLWRDGFEFGEGGLDGVIAGSAHLRRSLYRLLNSLGKSIFHLSEGLVPNEVYGKSSPDLEEASRHVKELLDRLPVVAEFSEARVELDDDVSSDEGGFNGPKDLIDNIMLSNDLLLDFAPALEMPAQTEGHENEGAAAEEALTQVSGRAGF
jgi:hypothetical protein